MARGTPLRVKLQRVSNRTPKLPLPRYHSLAAAGADLCADVDGSLTLKPGERALVSTGFAIELPKGYEGQVRPRSGLAVRSGLGMPNAPGTIDSDYRGEIRVALINWGKDPVTIHRGDRIAQLVIAPVIRAEFEESAELSVSERGEGGFGSTGR